MSDVGTGSKFESLPDTLFPADKAMSARKPAATADQNPASAPRDSDGLSNF